MKTVTQSLVNFFLAMFLAASAFAGGGPANTLVLYNPADANAVAEVSYYQQLRDIPDGNIVPYYFPSSPSVTYSNISYASLSLNATQAYQFVLDIRTVLSSRNLSNQIDYIVLAGATPTTFMPNLGSATLASLTKLLSDMPQISSIATVTNEGVVANCMYRGDADYQGSYGPYPNLAATEIRHDKVFSHPNAPASTRNYMAFSMGFSGWRGNTALETFNFLQRARNSDGTITNVSQRGTVYWCTNADVRYVARAVERPTTNEWATLGIPFAFCSENNLTGLNGTGSTPSYQRSVMGVVGDWVSCNLAGQAGTTYLPGAIGDTLTSFAGGYDSADQGKLTEFFRAGLAGSAGTVTEPYAFKEKFLHARLYSHYVNGASLGEAFYQSPFWMFELLMAGDPLTQPFADIPVVTITAPAAGATVSGVLTVSASATAVSGVEANLNLAVDGRIIQPGLPAGETVNATRVAGGFSLDTTTLSDGYHELRLIAYNNTAVRSQGYALRNVTVNNQGMSVALSAPATLDRRGSDTFTVTPAGLSGATNISIRFLGQTLTNLSVGGGAVTLSGRQFGFYGTNSLYAVANLSNGKQVASAPQKLVMTWSPMPATNGVTLNSNALAYVRLFVNVNAPGFSWDTNTPDAMFFFTDPVGKGLFFSPDIGSYFPYSVQGNTSVGHEFTTYFIAPTNSNYDFVVSGDADKKSLFIDGVPMFTNVASLNSGSYYVFYHPVVVTENLAAGLHQIVFRCVGNTRLKVGVRGPGLVATNYVQAMSDEVPLITHRKDYDVVFDISMGCGAAPGPNSYAPNWAVNPPPAGPTAVAITSPANGLINTTSSVVALSASVTGGSQPMTVFYYDGSTLVGSSTNAPNYATTSATLASGSHNLTVVVRDRFFQSATNNTPVSVTIGALSTPTANPPGGFFPTNVTVAFNHPDPSTSINYITNSCYDALGLNPYNPAFTNCVLSVTSKFVAAGGSITLKANGGFPITVVRALAQKAGANPSAISTYAFRQGWGMVAVGSTHALALKADGSVVGWGENATYGQLGIGNVVSPQTAPVAVPGLSNMVCVAGGSQFSVGLDQFARVWTWGRNSLGQLGNGTTDNNAHSSPILVTNGILSLGVRAIAAGVGFTMALRQDGNLYVWGDNAYGQIGTGRSPVYEPTVNAPTYAHTIPYGAIAAGGYHGLGIMGLPGQVYAWGLGTSGQLGATNNNSSGTPIAPLIPSAKMYSMIAVAGGLNHSLALCNDKTVYAWGANSYGQVGNGNTSNTNGPVLLGLTNIVAIAGGANHSMALDGAGRVWTWGRNNVGQLGNGATDASAHSTPALVSGITNAVAIYANNNSDSSYVMNANGVIVCWGANTKGQLGNGSTSNTNAPVSVQNLQITPPAGVANVPSASITSPTNGAMFVGTNSLAITSAVQNGTAPLTVQFTVNGTVLGSASSAPYSLTWTGMTNGTYTLGALVTDSLGLSSNAAPVTVTFTGVPTVSQPPYFSLAAGSYPDIQNVIFNCADTNVVLHYTTTGIDPVEADPVAALGGSFLVNRDTILKVRAFSANRNPSPVAAALYTIGTNRRSLSSGDWNILVQGGDGLVRTWGDNSYGELGIGNTTTQLTPVSVPALSNIVAVSGSCGGYSSLAIDRNGNLLVWGWNWDGQLGIGSLTTTNVPVPSLLSNVVSARMGGAHSVAVKADGTVWVVGGNDSGQLGNATYDSNPHPTPVQVPGVTGVAVAVGGSHSLVLTTNGNIWSWGDNTDGQLGIGNTNTNAVPPMSPSFVSNSVSGGKFGGVKALACSSFSSFAVKTNGTAWAWGLDKKGSLGIGPTASVNYFPAQVQNLPSNIVAIAAGFSGNSMALDSTGTVWTWGANDQGQLGNGTTDINTHAYPAALTNLSGVVAITCGQYVDYVLKADGSVWAWGLNLVGDLGDGSGLAQSVPVKMLNLTLPPGLAAGIFQPQNLSYTTNNSVTLSGAAFGPNGIQAVTANGTPVTTGNALTNWTITVGGLTGGTNLITVVTTNFALPTGVITNQIRILYADATFSATGDTVPDSWKIKYFGNNFWTNANASGSAVLVAGLPNWMEYLLGVNPLNPNDRFAAAFTAQPVAGGIQIQWASQPGLKYQVRFSNDLLTWTDLGVITASTTSTTWTDDGSQTGIAPGLQPKRYYWLKAVP